MDSQERIAKKLGLTRELESMRLNGVDEEQIVDILLALYCNFLQESKRQLCDALVNADTRTPAEAVMRVREIIGDTNYFWES